MPNFSGRYRSIGDASMRHRGTYIAVREETTGLLLPRYVEDVSGDRRNPTLILSSLTGESSQRRVGESDVVMERPTMCMANYKCPLSRKLFAVWHESAAHRQIKRSLDFSLIESITIGVNELSRYTNCNPSMDASSNRKRAIDSFYNKEYPRYSECLDNVATGRNYSLAFSDKFALCAHINSGVVLYYKDQLVGYLGDTHPILLSQFQYLQEQLEEAANGYV